MKVLNEKEAINLTIEWGFDGSEFKTKKWIDNGALQTDRTLDGLIKKLETRYEKVTYEGRGKKRRYILLEPKEKVSEIEYKYDGRPPTMYDKRMKEYIFNELVRLDNDKSLSYSGWVKVFNLPDRNSFTYDDCLESVKSFYEGHSILSVYNSKEIVNKILENVELRSSTVVKNSFYRLEKEGRIKVFSNYIGVKNLELKSISKEIYDAIENFIKITIAESEFTRYQYNSALRNYTNDKKLKAFVNELNNAIEKLFGYERVYKTYQIELIDRTIMRDLNHQECMDSFILRTVDLAKTKQAREKYKQSKVAWQRYFELNLYLILSVCDFNIPFDIEEEIHKFIARDKQLNFEVEYANLDDLFA